MAESAIGNFKNVVERSSDLIGPKLSEVMKSAIERLKSKNKDLLGRLCVVVGKGPTEVLIFDSPVKSIIPGREDERKEINEFLVVAMDGPMLIRIGPVDFYKNDVYLEHVTSQMRLKIEELRRSPENSGKEGYVDGVKKVGIKVLRWGEKDKKTRLSRYYIADKDSVFEAENVWIVQLVRNPDPQKIEQIYLKNLQRAGEETGINTKGLLNAKKIIDLTSEK